MTRTITASLLLLLCCSSLWAADSTGDRWRISILAAEISKDDSGPFMRNDTHAGIGLGIAYAPTPQWDVEFTVAKQSYVSPTVRLVGFPTNSPEGIIAVPVTEFHEYDVHPVDLSVTRHFLTDQPIAPYVRAGVRYVTAPDDPFSGFGAYPTSPYLYPGLEPVRPGFGFKDRLSAQAGAGVRVRLTPRTALRAEVTRLLRSENVDFDPLTRFAAGVSWVF
jgi:hypothetical protein